MFKFQRRLSGGENFTDHLYKENEFIGAIGKDKYGMFLNLERDLTLEEINLLIAQVVSVNPNLLTEKIEIHKNK